MEGRKQQVGSSSSSFTSELFGSKESSPSSSSGVFGSIFSPSSAKVFGREALRPEVSDKTITEAWSSKIGTQDDTCKGNGCETLSTANKDMSSIYQEQRVQPCHLSSSIYYGGQDICSHPPSTQNSGLTSFCKKDGGEDDSGSASRGNWWQGSLYY